jgi:hypothetical protein
LINLDNVIRGAGQLGAGVLQFDNRAAGVVEANQTQPLIVNPSGTGLINAGQMQANGGTLALQNGIFNNTGGTIAAISSGSLVEFAGVTVSGGTLSSVSGATLRNTGPSTYANLAFTAGSTLDIPNTSSATFKGAIANAGAIVLNSGGNTTDLILHADGVTLTGGGIISLSNTTANRFYGTGTLNNVDNTIQGSGQFGINLLTLTNTGIIQATQSNPLTIDLNNSTPFTNQGVLRATNSANLVFTDNLINAAAVFAQTGGTFTALGTFTQSAGSISVQSGTFAANSSTIQGGIVQGSGTISGPVSNSGIIAPGAGGLASGIGTLTFTQTLTLTPTSLLHLELGGVASFDSIQAPSLLLDGGLVVTFANGFESSISQAHTFTLLTTTNAIGLGGTFAGLVNGSRLYVGSSGGNFQIDYFANSFRLSDFQAVPEPSTWTLLGFGGAVLIFTRRRNRA